MNEDKIVVLGGIVDQHLLDKSVDVVDRAIKGLDQGDSSIDVDDVIKLYNQKHEEDKLGVTVWIVTLEKIDTRYYVFGINLADFPENSTMKSVKNYIQSETKKIVGVDVNVTVRILEKKPEVIFHYETYTNDLNA